MVTNFGISTKPRGCHRSESFTRTLRSQIFRDSQSPIRPSSDRLEPRKCWMVQRIISSPSTLLPEKLESSGTRRNSVRSRAHSDIWKDLKTCSTQNLHG